MPHAVPKDHNGEIVSSKLAAQPRVPSLACSELLRDTLAYMQVRRYMRFFLHYSLLSR
jgi:hypothetical protein